MYGLILSLVLSSPIHADRALVNVDGKDCVFKVIEYNDVDNLIWTKGNCQALYDMCTKDFCKVRKVDQEDLNFGNRDNIGKK